MRLTPGITLDYADDVLRRAETTWTNAQGAQDRYQAYTDAVNDTYPTLKQVFAAPDIGGDLHSTAYWNLLSIGKPPWQGPASPQTLPQRRTSPEHCAQRTGHSPPRSKPR
ncbi:hypothetical protein [Actinomadura chokoriensis]|uniref:hypothetical protein n=1 Tax=Actinomadura chokoriensis TaxID=454156 RepID=UPI0031F8D414